MQLAERMSRIGESATTRVSRMARELRARGVEVADLGVGEPDVDSPPVAVAAARRALADGFTKYTDAAGTPELRRAVAKSLAERYGAPWEGSDVVMTVGAKTGLFSLAMALFAAGDEVVLPIPAWVSFAEQIRFAGATPVTVATSGGDGFQIHAGPLIEAITDRTRAVLINSPSNPTGGVISAADLARLGRACADRGIPLISDETYDRFVYPGTDYASAATLAAELPETVILVGSFSKTYSMTGWRLGYVCAPPPVVKALAALQSHSTQNPTSFAMRGALAALAEADAYVAEMIAEFEVRRDLLLSGLAEIPGFVCQPPAGAFYAFPDVTAHYRSGRQGSVELAEFLLREAAVAVVPGLAFGSDDHVRISFACSRDTIRAGLARMAAALA